MWQQIQSNKKKSVILIIVMAILMFAVGYGGVYIYYGEHYALYGLLIAFGVWLIMLLVSYFQGDNIFLAMNNAKKIDHDANPKLYNVVEEMTLAAGLPKVPKIYVIDEQAPNAFATGRSPQKASIAVTTGLLELLNRNELQGVVAHELSHVKNRDTLYMLFAGIMLSSIILLADLFLRSRFRRGRRSSSGKGSSAELIILVACVLLMILAPFVAQLIYYAISRKREYLADACAAQFTRYPSGLADALAKISGTNIQLKCANRFTAPMYIVNPLAFNKKLKVMKDLSSTHPATSKRIEILYKMGGADVTAYDAAFNQVTGEQSGLFSSELLANTTPLGLVTPATKTESNNTVQTTTASEKVVRRRETEDMMWKLSDYSFHECECGTKIKTPPCYKGKTIICPHCQKSYVAN